MKQNIKIVLEQFEKHNNLIIINNDNFELFNSLPKIKSINRLHVEFKCKQCNCIVSRRADSFFRYPFICRKCISKEVHNDPEVRKKTEETCLAKYGVKHNVKIIINCDKYLDYVNFKYGTNFLNSLNKKQMLIS